MPLKRKTNRNTLSADNGDPATSVLTQTVMELRQQINQIQSELDQVKQENTTLHILNAQQLKDMESMRNKYARIEKENCSLKEENTILLSRMKVLEAENQQLRRMVFGQSTEKMDTAGQDDSNTTELPEETMCSTDKDTKESDMADGHPGDEPHSGDTSKGESCPSRQHGSGCGEKKPRPNNIRRRMEEKLPTVHRYPMSAQLIQKLDELYGKEQWRIMNWEGAQHLVHIPEIYVNQVDYVPVICLKDGTQVRPFTEHPEEFPTAILPHSILSASEFANIVHRKFALGIPLYRQEKDLEQMTGIHLGRQDMAEWIIRAGTQGFIQVYDYLIRQELACKYHNIDETFLQVLMDGRAASTKSYLWVHQTGELANPEHPVAVFLYEQTRAAEHLRKYFPEDIAAMICCDHYIAYETLESERENIHISLCWMHVRRRFFYAFDLISNIKGLSEETIRESLEAKLLIMIGQIYREEMKLKTLSPDKRKEDRALKVQPLVKGFFDMLHTLDPDDPNLSHIMQDAVKYTLDAEEKLKRFLDDPCISIDNGSAERVLRTVATGRRAWLFCDTPDGAKALALFYSFVATARMNDANDYYYVKYLCEHVPGGLLGSVRQLSDAELEALMPWSEEYRTYEKNEVQSRYDAVTTVNDMNRPTRDDIQTMRRQFEAEKTSVESDAAVEDASFDMGSEPVGSAQELPHFSDNSIPHDLQNAVEVFSPIRKNTLTPDPDSKLVGHYGDGELGIGDELKSGDTNICSNDKEIRRRTG